MESSSGLWTVKEGSRTWVYLNSRLMLLLQALNPFIVIQNHSVPVETMMLLLNGGTKKKKTGAWAALEYWPTTHDHLGRPHADRARPRTGKPKVEQVEGDQLKIDGATMEDGQAFKNTQGICLKKIQQKPHITQAQAHVHTHGHVHSHGKNRAIFIKRQESRALGLVVWE